jgi:AcrR family transcriptional regulator
MEDSPKPRRYDSPRRRLQAAATRREILAAALRLFEQRGYAATSVAAVASEAGVATKTVYLAFHTKPGLLLALWHLLLRGDEEAMPVDERPWFREVVEEPDPERLLRLNARNSRVVKERAGGLLEILSGAAPSDAELDTLWQRIQTEFYENQRSVVEQLKKNDALRPGIEVERSADILWTLNHPSVYALLVGERGWAPGDYEEWLGDASCSQLLRSRTREPSTRGKLGP